MRYKRARVPGGTYFFTIVTHNRRKTLCSGENPRILRHAFDVIQARRPFTIDAIVLLPDHLHCLWTLPAGDADFSTRWMLIKSQFTRQCDVPGMNTDGSRRMIWQNRFWEHQIRDDTDFCRHVEYIHYNPVRHGLVHAPRDWKYTSFHRYVKAGKYHPGWRAKDTIEFTGITGNE